MRSFATELPAPLFQSKMWTPVTTR